MAVNVVLNGVTYSIPEPGNDGWGQSLTDYFVAQASGLLQKAGGTFSLTAEVDFGTTYGLKSSYLKSRATNPASAGQIRLGNTESLSWRNAGNSADLALKANASNQLEFNSTKVLLSGAIVNADVDAAAAIVYSKLSLTGSIINADIAAGAAIERSKVATGTASHVLVNDGSGNLSSEATLAKSRGGTGQDNTSLTFPASGVIGKLSDANPDAVGTVASPGVSTESSRADHSHEGVTSINGYQGAVSFAAGTQLSLTYPLGVPTFGLTAPSAGPVRSDGTSLTTGNTNLASEVTGTLPIGNGGTGQTTKTPAFDALSPTTTAGDLILHNGTNNVRFAIGSDGQVPVVDTGLTGKLKWATLPTGTKNYITYGTFENNATTGWSKLTVGAVDSTTKAVSGSVTLSAAGITTFAATSTNPLAGSYSLSVGNASSALTVGQGIISDAYTIDREDRAKVLSFKFYYEVTTGASDGNWSGTSSNTLAIWIYDTVNSAWIQPSGSFGMTQSSGVGICQGTFQTPSNMTSFRIALVCINAPSGALVFNLDDVTVGPQVITQGTPVTDWQAYTPSFGAGWGTVSEVNVRHRRVGDTLEVSGSFVAGTVGATRGNIGLPSSLTIDTTKFASPANNTQAVGLFYRERASGAPLAIFNQATDSIACAMVIDSTTPGYVYPSWYVATNVFGQSPVNNIITNNERVWFEFRVPVTGWSSQVQMSSDTDTRIVSCRAYASSSRSVASGSPAIVNFNATSFDTHGTFNTSTGAYTVPVSGFYRVSTMMQVAPGGNWTAGNVCQAAVYKNGIEQSHLMDWQSPVSGRADVAPISGSTIVQCNAGDTLAIYIFQNQGSAVSVATDKQGWANFERVTGPSQIAASETVSAYYVGTPPTGTLSGAANLVTYGTKVKDTHGAYSSGTFTVPVSGIYAVAASFVANATHALGDTAAVYIYVNGVSKVSNCHKAAGAVSYMNPALAHMALPLLAGDVVQVKSYADASGVSFGAGADNSFFSITKVGNY